ncbi:protein FRIGIDA-ESSENTIAL 1 isoform X2 [Herrania umbratica]|uniref:Protein FRIGIDA-ESSENTIAL 1 isoform X2 n=1 Tax=Herrania umbratica TaxID=108875 RepID=A0A6J1B4S9_9ROSI|nr:protein FRIGIDA-ESSENTIAL 1 isoform X2 [Herrania umbratica]
MPLSTSVVVPRAERDDERRATSTTEREINSSDMEIDDDDEEEEEERDLQGSSNRDDASNILESKGHNGCLESGSFTPGKSETRVPSKSLAFSILLNEPLVTQKEDICMNYEGSKYPISGKQPAKEKATQQYVVSEKDARVILQTKAPENHCEQQSNSKSHSVISEIHSSVAGKEVVITIPVRYHSGGVNDVKGFKEKSKQMNLQSEDDKRKIKSRSAAPQTSTGSLSPGAELDSGSKRPAIICDFFARGWCIKGSSCRFLHIKDSGNNPRQQPEVDVATADVKGAVQLDEGFDNAAERSRSPGSTDTLPSSVENKTALSSHFFSERVLPSGHDENQRLHPFHEINKFSLLQSKDKLMGTSPASQQFSASIDDLGPSKDVRLNSIGQNLPADSYTKPASLSDRGSSTLRNSFLPEYRSSLSGSVTSLGNTYSENRAYCVSTWMGSFPFGSSLSACSFGAQKVSDSDREHDTSRLSSLLQSSSPFSRSEHDNFHLNDIARDPLHVADYRIKISSDDWEPSVPFRPSFFVTSSISPPRGQYNPLRDSIDMSNAGERSLKFSFSSQGPSLLNVTYPPTYGDSTSTGPVVPECNGDKKIASCHNRYPESLVDNNYHNSGKDSLTTDANDGTSAADMQNGTLVKEEISSVASHVKDISKANKIDTDLDGRHQRDGSRCKKDLKVGRGREKNEIDVEHKADGDPHKESKAMKHFRAALVDLIKELLKPTWREGHLNRDAHNTIVKKAVDKVLGAIQPHQIPITFESVKQYLSSSQPKIAKLVQGYVDKYSKS